MDFLISAKQRYYSKDNSEKILKKLSRAINTTTLSSRHELLCLFDGILSTTPLLLLGQKYLLSGYFQIRSLTTAKS